MCPLALLATESQTAILNGTSVASPCHDSPQARNCQGSQPAGIKFLRTSGTDREQDKGLKYWVIQKDDEAVSRLPRDSLPSTSRRGRLVGMFELHLKYPFMRQFGGMAVGEIETGSVMFRQASEDHNKFCAAKDETNYKNMRSQEDILQ